MGEMARLRRQAGQGRQKGKSKLHRSAQGWNQKPSTDNNAMIRTYASAVSTTAQAPHRPSRCSLSTDGRGTATASARPAGSVMRYMHAWMGGVG
jgi:hypothetical protein